VIVIVVSTHRDQLAVLPQDHEGLIDLVVSSGLSSVPFVVQANDVVEGDCVGQLIDCQATQLELLVVESNEERAVKFGKPVFPG